MPYSQATTHVNTNGIVWDTDGYYSFGNDDWKDVILRAKVIYNGGEIGLLPRFDSPNAYIAFTIGNHTQNTIVDIPTATTDTIASLYVQLGSTNVHLGEKSKLNNLVMGQSYEIRAEIKKTNFKIYLDNKLLFNVEYSGLYNGAGAIYGSKDMVCTLIEVQANFPEQWTTNAGTIRGSIVDAHKDSNDNQYIQMKNPGTETLYVRQSIDVQSATNYVVSYKSKGLTKIRIEEIDGTTPQVFQFSDTSINWTKQEHSFITSVNCTKVYLDFYLNEVAECSINDIQFEKSKFATSYVHNNALDKVAERLDSSITFPTEGNIDSAEGTISMWVSPTIQYDNTWVAPLFEFGNGVDRMVIGWTNGNFYFNHVDGSVHVLSTFNKGTWYHVAGRWSENNVSLFVNGVKAYQDGIFDNKRVTADTINIGYSIYNPGTLNGIMDDLIIFSRSLDNSEISEIYKSLDLPTTSEMLLRAKFDHAITNLGKSIIEVSPAPVDNSPILVTKSDGTPMRKVSFFDSESGEYRTYNVEPVIYDGKSDYIRVGWSNLDTDNFKITVRDKIGAIVGDPYTTSGFKIMMNLTKDQKIALRGETLFVSYQPNDTFTVDFNIGQPDSFRVGIGKYDGQPLTVEYEGSKYSNDKLATMIELNPLLNPNHEGFMYITRGKQEVATFRAKIGPNDLPADGVSEAIVVIEPLDSSGNFVSYARLNVTTKEGSVAPSYDVGSYILRERAGRYIYRYRAPLIFFKDKYVKEIVDTINIVDTKTGLGVQIPISLSLADSYGTGDRAIPIEEVAWEKAAVFILGKVTDNIGKVTTELPSGLGVILDLNNDGKIDINEIIWLNDYKYSQDLYDKYLDLLGWYQAN